MGRKGYLDLGQRKTERVMRDTRRVHPQTNCLVGVGVGRSDGGHESNSSCHTITKVPSVCQVTAVLVMSIDECVKKTQNHDAILKASQEHPGDQIV